MTRSKIPANVGAAQLAQEMDAGRALRLLDVRTAGEFARSRIAGSYNVPLDALPTHAAAIAAVRDPIVLVCRSGARARSAERLLRDAGARSVHVLDGGMIAWRRHSLPAEGTPVSLGTIVRRAMGFAGLALAALNLRTNPILAVALAFVGLRLAMGQSVLPCAAAGTCALPADTSATVRALVDGRPAGGIDEGEAPSAAATAG